MQACAAGLGFTPGLGSSAGLGSTAGLGSQPGLGLDATPALGSDYGSETPFVGGLGLGATPSVQSGQPQEEAKQVGKQLWRRAPHAMSWSLLAMFISCSMSQLPRKLAAAAYLQIVQSWQKKGGVSCAGASIKPV